MKASITFVSLVLASVLALIVPHTMATSLRGFPLTRMLRDDDDSVLCRMLVLTTEYDGTRDISSQPETQSACVPIVNGDETEDLIIVDLPTDIESNLWEQGELFVTITHSQLINSEIISTVASQFIILEELPRHLRYLQSSTTRTTGDMTVAVVRIATKDARCSLSNGDIEAMLDLNKVNFVTQYRKCSFGQLRFQKAQRHIIDVRVDEYISTYSDNGANALVTAAQKELLEKMKVTSFTEIADKILMCVPEGTGNWVASAGFKHWRSQYNDKWTQSLSADMHEIGHNIGLMHANENGNEYEDETGYMGRSFRDKDFPVRCFNGQNNHVLGWYDKMSYDPTTSATYRLFDLTGPVHYKDQANTVLVNLADEIYVQYNHATLFNQDTGELANQVTITAAGRVGSELLGGIVPGQEFELPNFKGSGQTLVIRACGALLDDGEILDSVTVSIGMGEAYCSTPSSPTTLEPIISDSKQVGVSSLLQRMIKFLASHRDGQ